MYSICNTKYIFLKRYIYIEVKGPIHLDLNNR